MTIGIRDQASLNKSGKLSLRGEIPSGKYPCLKRQRVPTCVYLQSVGYKPGLLPPQGLCERQPDISATSDLCTQLTNSIMNNVLTFLPIRHVHHPCTWPQLYQTPECGNGLKTGHSVRVKHGGGKWRIPRAGSGVLVSTEHGF